MLAASALSLVRSERDYPRMAPADDETSAISAMRKNRSREERRVEKGAGPSIAKVEVRGQREMLCEIENQRRVCFI